MLALLAQLSEAAPDRETVGPKHGPPGYFVEIAAANGLKRSEIDGLARELGRGIQEQKRNDLIRETDPNEPSKAFETMDETIHRSKDPKPR